MNHNFRGLKDFNVMLICFFLPAKNERLGVKEEQGATVFGEGDPGLDKSVLVAFSCKLYDFNDRIKRKVQFSY